MEPWERYIYRVEWSEEDGEFVGLCAELPGLSWLAPTQRDALAGIVTAARDSVEILEADGEPVPEPLSTRRYSGIFKVRVPPEVHKSLVLEAAEQNVSLNRMVTVKLARGQQAMPSKRPIRRSARSSSHRRRQV
ncbi:MAG TPA: toxin-antitoxin system HicB family antitoxin [Thermoanaerobaculia bacterium]|jgi:predicted HicB family RNase H-like nuclease